MAIDQIPEHTSGFRRIRELLSLLPLPAVLIHRDRSVAFVNPLGEKQLPFLKAGQDLVFGLRDPEVLEAVEKALDGATPGACELSVGKPLPRLYQVQVQPITLDDAPDAWVLLTFTDTTVLRENDRIRSAFIANVSHELRSPLTTLLSAIETIKSAARDDPGAQARFLDMMEEEGLRMRRIVDDLLSLARLEAHEHIPPSAVVEIPKLLDHVMGVMKERAKAKGMNLRCACAKGLPAIVGDGDELQEVLDNLIENAVKYGDPGTEIALRVEAVSELPETGGEGVRIAVTNQGKPIPPEHIPRLTERFYRVDKSRSRALGGTGLGLAIVKHIVNRHRGALKIESSAAKGTTFTIFLPR
jgi:two-component system, OmpR family, phosphate regulon sensor histidine kinase PhoR